MSSQASPADSAAVPAPCAEFRPAIAIGSYAQPNFVELNIKTIREVFGDVPILVSDDLSQVSDQIRRITSRHDVEYVCSEDRRGHFAADMQVFVNALAFAGANGCTHAVKVSQRFIFLSPEVRDQAIEMFSRPQIKAIFPGKPTQASRRNFFGIFNHLTDVAFLSSEINPEWLIEKYRYEVENPTNKYSCFVEFFWDKILKTELDGQHETFGLITNHVKDGNQLRYLRRYQNTEHEYVTEARKRGLYSRFDLGEWNQIERGSYVCRPRRV